MNEIIITGGVGMLTTIVSGITSWFLARRKYNSEVDNTLISNMKSSLDFYKELSDDNKRRLDEALNRSDKLEEEITELRTQVFKFMSIVCTDLTCQLRNNEYKSNKNI